MAKKKKSKKSTGKKSISSRLKAMQKAWKKTEPLSFGITLPDDEGYVGEIESAVVELAQSSGRVQVNWTVKVTEGEFEGTEVHKYSGIDSEQNLPYFQGELDSLGITIPDDIEDVGEALEEAVGMSIEFNIRTANGFTNLDFVGPGESSEKDGEDEEEEEEKSDEEEDEDEDEESEDEDEEEAEEVESDEDEDEESEYLTSEDVNNMSKKELTELNTKNELKISIDKYPTLKKLRAVVLKKLEL